MGNAYYIILVKKNEILYAYDSIIYDVSLVKESVCSWRKEINVS